MDQPQMLHKPSQDLVQKNPTTSQAIMKSIYHPHELSPNQCGSTLVQTIDAPLPLVWSIVRNFKKPQTYKRFIKTSTLSSGNGGVGSVREIDVISGLPAQTSIERLDKLDDESHVMVFSVIGGDHRLVNCKSITTLHEDEEVRDGKRTVVMESYVMDVPENSCKEDICFYVDTLIR